MLIYLSIKMPLKKKTKNKSKKNLELSFGEAVLWIEESIPLRRCRQIVSSRTTIWYNPFTSHQLVATTTRIYITQNLLVDVDQWQVELVDLQSLSRRNREYTYLLTFLYISWKSQLQPHQTYMKSINVLGSRLSLRAPVGQSYGSLLSKWITNYIVKQINKLVKF